MGSGGEQKATGRDTLSGETGVPGSKAYREILKTRAWVTPVIIAANVVAFGLIASAFNAVNLFNPLQVTAWGANSGLLDLSGQWWRLVTYQFLHANLLHVAINMLVLWTVGRITERLYGSVTLLFVYLAAGVIAGLASAVWNPFQTTVGASGSIFGIVGAFIAIVLLRRDDIPASRLRYLAIAVLFAGINLYFGTFQPAVDNAAHAGGLLAGLLIGAVMTASGETRRYTIRPSRDDRGSGFCRARSSAAMVSGRVSASQDSVSGLHRRACVVFARRNTQSPDLGESGTPGGGRRDKQ